MAAKKQVHSGVGRAAGKSTAVAIGARKREYEKREQKLIRELVDKKWPGGTWKHLPLPVIMKGLEPEFKKRGLPVPKPDTFRRALGRRKG